MKNKPRLSFWQIWNMSFGFFGIQFGFALQNANVSRIFETLGAKIDQIPILWIAAPVTGLIVQPIIGHMSDRTWTRLGRRRPFFLAGAIFASLALIIMPNSPVLWIAAGMLWIMDASINISMEPFRAFVGDLLPSEQRTKGFALQSFFIGTGAVIASALPYVMTNWLNIENTAAAGKIPPSVKFSFYIGAAIFFLAVLWTVISTKEYSPEALKAFDQGQENNSSVESDQASLNSNMKKYLKSGIIWLLSGLILTFLISSFHLNEELYILTIGIALFGILQLITWLLKHWKKSENGLVAIIDDLFSMPKTMKQLAVVQFFSWFSLFAMWIYTTAAVTRHIYGTTDTTSVLYNEGADWVGISFAVYNGFAAIIALFLPGIAKLTSRRVTHMIALLVGALGLFSIYFIQNPDLLIISMIGVGMAWASILSMPYAMLADALPSEKMGVFMGIFNFFIVLPQILAASILGFIIRDLFNGEAIYALMLGGGSWILAALITLFIEDKSH